MRRATLSDADAAAVLLAALTAAGRLDEIRARAAELARASSLADLRETIYVASLFCGFPRGVAALGQLKATGDPPCHRDGAQKAVMLLTYGARKVLQGMQDTSAPRHE